MHLGNCQYSRFESRNSRKKVLQLRGIRKRGLGLFSTVCCCTAELSVLMSNVRSRVSFWKHSGRLNYWCERRHSASKPTLAVFPCRTRSSSFNVQRSPCSELWNSNRDAWFCACTMFTATWNSAKVCSFTWSISHYHLSNRNACRSSITQLSSIIAAKCDWCVLFSAPLSAYLYLLLFLNA